MERAGKSTLAIFFGYLLDEKFNLINNMSLIPTEAEIVKEFRALPKYSAYIIDEAIKGLYKMNFYSMLQQAVIKMFATEGYQNKISFLLLPRFRDLTEQIRNHRVSIWIHIPERGIANVYKRDEDPHEIDPWHLRDALSIKSQHWYKKRKFSILDRSSAEKQNIEIKVPNYWFTFTFPDLPEKIKDEYVALKMKSRERFDKEFGKELKSYREMKKTLAIIRNLILFLRRKLGYTQEELVTITGRSTAWISKLENDEEVIDEL